MRESLKQLTDFRGKLVIKRVYGAEVSATVSIHDTACHPTHSRTTQMDRVQLLGINLGDHFQFSGSAASIDNRVSNVEARHYFTLLDQPEFLDVEVYKTSKEATIHWMLYALKLFGPPAFEYNLCVHLPGSNLELRYN